MLNKFLALFALVVLIGFLAILFFKVPRIDLGAVILFTLVLAGYDFFKTFRDKKEL